MDIVLVLLVHLPVDDPGGHEVDGGKRGAVHGSWTGEQTPELGVLVKSEMVLMVIISFIIFISGFYAFQRGTVIFFDLIKL